MALQQISVFLENRAGQLAEITGVLAENGIDLRALHISETSDYGVLRLIATDSAGAEKVLKENGFLVSVTPVVAVSVPDRPGGLGELVGMLAAEDINIAYAYSYWPLHTGKVIVVIKVDDEDLEKAKKVFEGQTEILLLGRDELLNS